MRCILPLFLFCTFVLFSLFFSATSMSRHHPTVVFPFFSLLLFSFFLPPRHHPLIPPSLWSLRHWVQSWPRPETKPRRRRTMCYTPRTWKRAGTNTKRCARSDRATRSSASTSSSPCENGASVPSPSLPSGGVPAPELSPQRLLDFSWTTDAAVLVIPPSPPQQPQAILRNHLVKLCQSPARHLHSESSGYLPHMELPTRHSANIVALQRSSVILKHRGKEKL